MERVLIDMDHMKNVPYILIEHIDALLEYKKHVGEELSKTITRVLRSNVKPERWDHLLWGKNLGDSALMMGLQTCNIMGGNPLIKSGELLDEKVANMLKYLNKGEQVLANYNGGYCFLTDNMSMKPDTTYVEPVNYKIADNPGYINLENDPELEQHVKDWFHYKKGGISYVVNLRSVIGEDLVNILKRFKMKGGHTVYIYTTGLDIPEMYEYSDSIIEAEIKNVIFEFNAGMSDDHHDVTNYLKGAGVHTTYSEV